MTPIAHRGLWWPDRFKQNSLVAIAQAFRAGFGVEIDVRRSSKELVLAHDPEGAGDPTAPSFNDALVLARQFPNLPILVDVKEPGTEADIALHLYTHDLLSRAYLFDFGLCGADPHQAIAKFPTTQCLIRVSDRQDQEKEADIPKPWCRGVWLDQWDSEWVREVDIQKWSGGGPVFVVAPDLHSRIFDFKHLQAWKDATGICTDVPHLVHHVMLGGPPLTPHQPWWIK